MLTSPASRLGRRLRAALAVALVVSSPACAPPEQPPATPPPVAPPPPAPPGASAAPPAGSPAYAGHGAASVSPEILAKYAARPLPADASRRIQTLLDVRAPGGGCLSPDGKALYFNWSITGISQVFRLDGPQRFPIQLTGGEDVTRVEDVTPDGRHLVLSRDRKGEENPGLYLQDVKGGPLLEILHKPNVRAFLQHLTDDSRHLYYRANDIKIDSYAVYRYDIAARKREVVFDQPGIWRVFDVARDGRLLLGKDVGARMTEVFEWDPAKKALTPILGQGEREEHEAAYGAGPGEILVLTPKLGEFRRLYRWKDAKLTPATPELKADVEKFQIDRARARVLYQVNDGGFTRLHALDPITLKEIALPPLPPADSVAAMATTRDGRFTTLQVGTAKAPPSAYVLDWRGRKLVEWHAPSTPEVDTAAFAAATLDAYPARDGTRIPMLVRRPAACDAPCPVIVSFHGGPEGQSRPGFNIRAQLFVDAGFIYVEPNVRGSDGYGKTWLHADDGPKRLAVITDIEDAAKHVRAAFAHQGKPPKVGIFGGSYGGYSTLLGMTRFAGAYDAGASVVGISNLVTFLQNTAPYRRVLRISEYGDPDKDRAALIELSPITHLDRIKAPLLILQGATDPRVPAGESIQIQQALEAKKIPSELILFPDEGHGAQKRDNQVLQYGHILRFFKEHLKR